jgi:hypothetical protein
MKDPYPKWRYALDAVTEPTFVLAFCLLMILFIIATSI